MKLMVRGFVLALLACLMIMIKITFGQLTVREDELNTIATQAISTTQISAREQIEDRMYNKENARCRADNSCYNSNEDYLNDLKRNLTALITSKSTYEIKVYGIDYQKGLLDVEIVCKYTQITGKEKTLSKRKTSIVEVIGLINDVPKPIENEKKDEQQHTIIFVNDDGTILQSSQIKTGEIPVFSGQTPTKDSTPEYKYTFNGWDKTISAATNDETYTATYISKLNIIQLEYIESPNLRQTANKNAGNKQEGTWIDTEVDFNSGNNITATIEYEITNENFRNYVVSLYGALVDNGSFPKLHLSMLSVPNATVGAGIYYPSADSAYTITNNPTISSKIQTNTKYTTTISYDYAQKSSYTIYLFMRNNDQTNNFIPCPYLRMYSVQMYKDSELIRDYIPAEYTGKIGMYDKVEDKFYENKGGGQFIAGNAMN